MTGPAERYAHAASLFKQALAEGAPEAETRAAYDEAVARIAASEQATHDAAPSASDQLKAGTPGDYSRAPSAARTGVGLAAKAVQGLGMGTLDELGGALLAVGYPSVSGGKLHMERTRGATFGDRRREGTNIVRGLLSDTERAAPVASTVAEIGGAVLPLVFGGAPSLTGALAGRAGVTGAKAAVARGVGRVASGATMAAVAGAGNASGGAGARGKAAIDAALLGGGLAAAIPAGGALFRGGRNATAGAITRRGVQRMAARLASGSIDDAGRTIPQVEAALTNATTAGKPLTLMEHIGDPARKLARGAKTNSAAAGQTLSELADARMPGTAGRVDQDIRQGLGVGTQTTMQAGHALDAERAAIEHGAFTPERMAAPVTSPAVAHTLTASPVYRDAFESMQEAAALNPGNTRLPALFDETGLTRHPTMDDIESIRQGLADIVDSPNYATRATTNGPRVRPVTASLRRNVEAARHALLDDPAMALEHPWYAPARAQLSDVHNAGRALTESGGLLASPVTDAAETIGAMGPREAHMARLGVANDITNAIQKKAPVSVSQAAGGGSGATARVEKMNRLLALAPGAPAGGVGPITPGVNRMGARLGAEDQIAQTERFLSGQSNTADKLRESEKVMGVVKQVLQGGKGFVANAMDALSTRLQGNTGRVSAELARMLSALDPTEQAATLRALQAERDRMLQRAVLSRALQARGGAQVSAQTTRGQTP